MRLFNLYNYTLPTLRLTPKPPILGTLREGAIALIRLIGINAIAYNEKSRIPILL
ncbi:MAG: hypothetical protein AB4290_23895 [Spirulina sp.]